MASLAAVLEGISAARLPRQDSRWLMRAAVGIALSGSGGVGWSDSEPFAHFEEALIAVQDSANLAAKPSVSEAKAWLRSCGTDGASIASRLGRVSKRRNGAAHPDVSLIRDIRQFAVINGEVANTSCGGGSGSGSSYDDGERNVVELGCSADEFYSVAFSDASTQTCAAATIAAAQSAMAPTMVGICDRHEKIVEMPSVQVAESDVKGDHDVEKIVEVPSVHVAESDVKGDHDIKKIVEVPSVQVAESDVPSVQVAESDVKGVHNIEKIVEGPSVQVAEMTLESASCELVELWDSINDEAVDAEKSGSRCMDALAAAAGGLDSMDHSTKASDLWGDVYAATRDLTRWLDERGQRPAYRMEVESMLEKVRGSCCAGNSHLVELAQPSKPSNAGDGKGKPAVRGNGRRHKDKRPG